MVLTGLRSVSISDPTVKVFTIFRAFTKKILGGGGRYFFRQNFWNSCIVHTVKSVLVAASSNHFDRIFDQNLLSKKWILLRVLFEGGFYLRAASNTDDTVHTFSLYLKYQSN